MVITVLGEGLKVEKETLKMYRIVLKCPERPVF